MNKSYYVIGFFVWIALNFLVMIKARKNGFVIKNNFQFVRLLFIILPMWILAWILANIDMIKGK